ncbi:MAG: hydrophobe/amphiphile efflux-1 family RND transporter, partial [Rhodospirillales bacterium]
MSPFFIRRPRFAGVIAVVIVLAGVLSVAALPVAQFPDITPPVVQVSTFFPGANAEVVELAVAQPIEEMVNGVDGMLYMSSRSADDGSLTIDVTFAIGTDPDVAAINVQNRVDRAMGLLPPEVQRQGVITQAQQPSLLLIVNLTSPEGTRDALFLSNYASINILDRLRRLDGVGEAEILGALDYGMRIWLDTPRMASLGVSPADVRDAILEQNVEVAPGQLGAPPARDDQQFQYSIRTQGRLADAREFEDIIIRARADGAHVRIRDVARVELGAQRYGAFGRLNGLPSTNVAVFQQPGANALAIADAVRAEMKAAAEAFPEDVEFSVLYDTTIFVRESVAAVVTSLILALVLVILVIFVFLQNWRSTVIPAVTIPVSLIGTLAALNAIGFTINTITLFALILAIGIVVDDAIIVVENVQRKLARGAKPADAAREAMSEVTGPIIATTLVLLAVFVP